MSTFYNIFKTISSVFSKTFYFIASLASIFGVVYFFITDQTSVLFALSFFCLMLLSFTIALILALFKILEINHTDHKDKSTYVKYETFDGNKIVYECYKVIQCKKPMLTDFEYNFKWSGTHLPVVTSKTQEVTSILDFKDPTKYDKALLKFKTPLYYNQNSVIHFKADLDDTDHKSSPHLEIRVTDEVELINFRVVLRHKTEDFKDAAKLQRRKLDSIASTYEELLHIPFDFQTKSFEYQLINPEVNYFYRIIWVR